MKVKNKEHDYELYAQVGVIVILLIILSSHLGGSGIGVVSAKSVIPAGVPATYGEELGITYDDVSPVNPTKADQTIRLLGNIDVSENLEGAELERYISILYDMDGGMSCEYCCGARSIIFSDGNMACGCAHSYAMRGLTKYLIKYHGDEFTDEQILTEVGKWKVLFFPGILEGKADVMKSKGLNTDYISLTTNQYRGIEQGQVNGGMIGSC